MWPLVAYSLCLRSLYCRKVPPSRFIPCVASCCLYSWIYRVWVRVLRSSIICLCACNVFQKEKLINIDLLHVCGHVQKMRLDVINPVVGWILLCDPGTCWLYPCTQNIVFVYQRRMLCSQKLIVYIHMLIRWPHQDRPLTSSPNGAPP